MPVDKEELLRRLELARAAKAKKKAEAEAATVAPAPVRSEREERGAFRPLEQSSIANELPAASPAPAPAPAPSQEIPNESSTKKPRKKVHIPESDSESDEDSYGVPPAIARLRGKYASLKAQNQRMMDIIDKMSSRMAEPKPTPDAPPKRSVRDDAVILAKHNLQQTVNDEILAKTIQAIFKR